MTKRIIEAEVYQIDHKGQGYTDYAFFILNYDDTLRLDCRYVICTRCPNWNHRELRVGEIGILEFIEINAGEDKWFDGEKFTPYRYSNWQFIKFISKPTKTDYGDLVIDLLKIGDYTL